MNDAALEALRERHQDLAEVIDSDRAIAAMRRTSVIILATMRLRRERVRAAEMRWGHPLRGNGNNQA